MAKFKPPACIPCVVQEIKKPGSNLKIPVVAGVIGVVIVVVIFGSGMMHQQLQQTGPVPSPVNPSPTPAHVISPTTHAVPNNMLNRTGGTVTTSAPTNTTGTTTLSSTISSGVPIATNQSITTNRNTPVSITLTGTDPNPNATLTAHITSPPLYGLLSSINQDTGVVTYTPNQGFKGNDSFTFKINDGKVDSTNVATVNIRVGRS